MRLALSSLMLTICGVVGCVTTIPEKVSEAKQQPPTVAPEAPIPPRPPAPPSVRPEQVQEGNARSIANALQAELDYEAQSLLEKEGTPKDIKGGNLDKKGDR